MLISFVFIGLVFSINTVSAINTWHFEDAVTGLDMPNYVSLEYDTNGNPGIAFILIQAPKKYITVIKQVLYGRRNLLVME